MKYKYHPTLLCILLVTLAPGGCVRIPENLDPPNVSIASLRPTSIGLLEQRFAIGLRIQNPNDVGINIRGLSFQLDINGREFARGVSNKGAKLPAFGEDVLEVDIVSTLFNLFSQMQTTEKNAGPLRYRLSGKISLGYIPGSIPFEHEGEFDFDPASPESGFSI